MTDDDATADLRDAERRLQVAQLTGDVDALDRLLDDRLVFTFGPDGRLYSKNDYLDSHRTRRQTMSKLVEEDLRVLADGPTGVTCFLGSLEGQVCGGPFAMRMRYTRTWIRHEQHGWQILAAHASVV